MDDLTLLQRHPALRWFAPLVAVGIAGVVVGVVLTSRSGSRALPATTAPRLLAQMHSSSADVSGLSGTVISHVSLGLPGLPGVATSAAASALTLLSGSHTLEVWYGGPERERVDVLGSDSETDFFRDGTDAWQWNSAAGVAQRLREVPDAVSPGALAQRAMNAMRSSTAVSVSPGHRVAGRPTYEMVLRPRTRASTVGSVHIAVDGATKVPLAVQVYPRGSGHATVDVSYTSVAFGAQSPRNFTFSPPHGSTVRDAAATTAHTHSLGSGWTTVLRASVPAHRARALTTVAELAGSPAESGAWGSGRLLQTPLVSALLARRGDAWSIYAGAVEPARLLSAAAAGR